MIDLSIIIVNWNSHKYLEKCMETIVSNAKPLKYEVIVVDNASYDGSKEVVEKYKDVAVHIQSDQNLGFAKANNLGFRHAKGQYLLFLNPDTEILDDTLVLMHRFLSSNPKAGCLGCKVLNTDGSIQTSCVQAFPSISNQILDSEFLRNRFPKWKLWGMAPLFERSGNPVPVDTVAGSCVMIDHRIFEVIGGFSEKYFMFAEDRDLCFKASRQGYGSYYLGSCSIIHHGGGSTKKQKVNFKSTVLQKESTYRYFTVNKNYIYAYIFRFGMFISSAVRILIMLFISSGYIFIAEKRGLLVNKINKWKSVWFWALGIGDYNL